MTKAGWIFMLGAWTAITAALAYCFYLILSHNKLREQAEGEPPPNT